MINQTEIVHFKDSNRAQADNLIQIKPQLILLAKTPNPDDLKVN